MKSAIFTRLHFVILICAFGLLTINLSAQTFSQNFNKSAEIKELSDKDETPVEATEKNKTNKKKTEKKSAKAQTADFSRFGGHVGIVIPIVSRGNGTTTTIADDFIIGFPFALTVKTKSPVAFDFEFVPTINTPSNQDFRFLIHPGIIYNFKKKYAVGVRAAYEFGTGNYGFTPIANRSFKLTEKLKYFVEADFPVRRQRRPNRTRFASIGFAIHSGIAF